MYGSIDGVKDNLPRLADNIKPEAQATDKLDIKEETVKRFLTEFSAQVDAALALRYDLPLSEKAKPLADKIVNDLAAYKLARRYWINISADENKELKAMRDDAKDTLTSLMDGTLTLDQDQKGDPEDISEMLAEFRTEEEIFSMGDPSEWQDKL